MKKIYIIFILTLVLSSTINISGISVNDLKHKGQINVISSGYQPTPDNIDQCQTYHDNAAYAIDKDHYIAQSFKPSLNVITRVLLLMFEWKDVNYKITVSIKDNLQSEKKLTEVTLAPQGYLETPKNIEFDFPDVVLTPGETYYIVCTAKEGDVKKIMCYGWYLTYDGRMYTEGSAYRNNDLTGFIWETDDRDTDCCFVTYGYNDPNAHEDLSCHGNLVWDKVKASSTVTGSFTIQNDGFNGSFLDWQITEYPEWGRWEFSDMNGVDLTPSDGPQIIQVTVVVPEEKNTIFTGMIKVVNSNNPADYGLVSIDLSTPKIQYTQESLPLKLFTRIPNIFPILEQRLISK